MEECINIVLARESLVKALGAFLKGGFILKAQKCAERIEALDGEILSCLLG